jgi:hypothetical protein
VEVSRRKRISQDCQIHKIQVPVDDHDNARKSPQTPVMDSSHGSPNETKLKHHPTALSTCREHGSTCDDRTNDYNIGNVTYKYRVHQLYGCLLLHMLLCENKARYFSDHTTQGLRHHLIDASESGVLE